MSEPGRPEAAAPGCRRARAANSLPGKVVALRRVALAVAFLAFALLFLIVNRGAYQGYFHGDELDNIHWTRYLAPRDWVYGFLSPKYYPQNFRPAGHFYFKLMGERAELDFRPYVLSIHFLHLANVALLWLLLRRRFRLVVWSAAAGALFFAFHMAVFDALWKPMYVFDLLACTFSLLCLLTYSSEASGARAAAFVFFWLALKSKEMTVMLPAALAAWEYWFGRKRWLRLLPFLAVSLGFGIQALLVNVTRQSEYTMHFSPAEIWKSIAYYSSKIFLLPYAGLGLIVLPFVARRREVWFGLGFFALLLAPMLLLSGRLFGAYLYLPLAGLAMAAGAVAARTHPAAVAAFFLLWLPYNHASLRAQRREALSLADENRRYVTRLREIAPANPGARTWIYDGVPAALHVWGIEAAVKLFAGRSDLQFYPAEGVNLEKVLGEGSGVVLLSWDPVFRELSAFSRAPGEPDASYITVSRRAPVWQFGEGWYSLTGHFRWCRPYATARMRRPPGAKVFELVVNMGPPPLREPVRATVTLNGRVVGWGELRRGSGWHTLRWPLPEDRPGPARVEIRVEPPYVDDPAQPLGLAVGAFGFLPREQPR
ncbi:MAG: hypothetical protein ACP5U2_08995 [Bryobacteraceae bacterium]